MITVDERQFAVDVTDIGLDVEFVYKYAERTESGEMQYELGAVYYNQSITFGTSSSQNEDFKALFKLLSTKSNIDNGTGHRVAVQTPIGEIKFMMYPDKLSMKMLHADISRGETWWTGFTVNFTALKPTESW